MMETTTPKLRTRKVARAIVLNEYGEILLIKHVDRTPANPKEPDRLTYWVPPGGGVNDQETFEQAAMRELVEETGIEIKEVERCILVRDVDLNYAGELVAQHERFFLSKISGRPDLLNYDSGEGITDARWWPLAAIENSTEIFFPVGLSDLMKEELEKA